MLFCKNSQDRNAAVRLDRYHRAPKAFHEGTLWPEFLALCEELHAHLDELTTRVIREAINEDVSEPDEQTAPPKALPEATNR